jgi:hypothetical protein
MSLFMFKLKLWLQNKHIIRFSTVLFTFFIVLMIMIPATVLSKEITIPKKNIFLSISHPFFFHSLPPFPYVFHPSSLPSIFIQLFSPLLSLPLSLSLSHFATFPHVLNCLSFLIAHSAPCFLSFRLIPVSSLLIQHLNLFFFLLHSLPPGIPEFPLSYTSHTPCCIWIL